MKAGPGSRRRCRLLGQLVWVCGWVLVVQHAVGRVESASRLSKRQAGQQAQCRRGVPIVYLTINPTLFPQGFLSRGSRKLQMNWMLCGHRVNTGDTVRLFVRDPSTVVGNGSSPSAMASPGEVERTYPALSGRHPTKFAVPEFKFDVGDLQANGCLGYWVAYVAHDGRLLSQSCLGRRPRWMQEIRSAMNPLRLADVALPGTHNAGSHSGYSDFLTENVRNKFLINQEESVFNQLVLGIRYLDIRVGYYPHTPEKFFVNHDKVRVQPLRRVLDDITKFITNTEEILIIDFHRFPVGFNHNVHMELIELILGQRSWARLALPKSPRKTNVTLGEMWAGGHRLVLAYEDEAAENGNDFLWENVIHLWANTMDTASLREYLGRKFESARMSLRGRVLYTANAFLTPQVSDVIGGIQASSLRVLADQAQRAGLDEWFATDWRHNFTIVSTDFFMSNRMVALCEEVNAERGQMQRAAAARDVQQHQRGNEPSLASYSYATSSVATRPRSPIKTRQESQPVDVRILEDLVHSYEFAPAVRYRGGGGGSGFPTAASHQLQPIVGERNRTSTRRFDFMHGLPASIRILGGLLSGKRAAGPPKTKTTTTTTTTTTTGGGLAGRRNHQNGPRRNVTTRTTATTAEGNRPIFYKIRQPSNGGKT